MRGAASVCRRRKGRFASSSAEASSPCSSITDGLSMFAPIDCERWRPPTPFVGGSCFETGRVMRKGTLNEAGRPAVAPDDDRRLINGVSSSSSSSSASSVREESITSVRDESFESHPCPPTPPPLPSSIISVRIESLCEEDAAFIAFAVSHPPPPTHSLQQADHLRARPSPLSARCSCVRAATASRIQTRRALH